MAEGEQERKNDADSGVQYKDYGRENVLKCCDLPFLGGILLEFFLTIITFKVTWLFPTQNPASYGI